MSGRVTARFATLLAGDSRRDRLARGVVFLLLMAPFAIVAALSCRRTYQDLTSLTLSRRESLAYLAAGTLKERLDRLTDLGVSLATRVRFRTLIHEDRWGEAIAILKSVPEDFPFIDRIFLTNTEGTEMAAVPPLTGGIGKNFAFRDWFQGVSRDWSPYVSEAYQRKAEPRYNIIAVAVPIRSDRVILGILVLQIRIATLLDWAAQIEVGPEGLVYFVDHKGRLAAHPAFPSEGDLADFSSVPTVQRVLRGERGVEIAFNPVEGAQRLVAYAPIPEYGWGVVVAQALGTAFAARDTSLRRSLAVYGMFGLMNALLALWLVRVLSSIAALRGGEQALLEGVGDGSIATNGAGRILMMNAAARVMLGWKAEAELGKSIVEAIRLQDDEGHPVPVEQRPMSLALAREPR